MISRLKFIVFVFILEYYVNYNFTLTIYLWNLIFSPILLCIAEYNFLLNEIIGEIIRKKKNVYHISLFIGARHIRGKRRGSKKN